MTKTNYFDGIIGQDVAKRKLSFYLDNYRASNYIPHLMFVAPKGCGKTTIAKAVGRNLVARGSVKAKKFLEINCSTIKNIKQLFNQVIIPQVNHEECTVLFDEASELPKDVTMAFLTILNPNPENRTSFSMEDYVVDFDFSRQSFMFATTEAQSIFHALMDRCDRVDLEEYTYNELGLIVGNNLEGFTFQDGLLEEIATVLRGNARAAQKMANNIKAYLAKVGKERFGQADWTRLKYSLGILVLGLSRIELQILRILETDGDCSLTKLAAKTGLTPECIRRDFEMYLQKNNLMEISRSGRGITKKGQDYLREVAIEEEKGEPPDTIRIRLPSATEKTSTKIKLPERIKE
jgi:Holliday junction resolvasome RuvABC ATP-dependent DNA helicase subunit